MTTKAFGQFFPRLLGTSFQGGSPAVFQAVRVDGGNPTAPCLNTLSLTDSHQFCFLDLPFTDLDLHAGNLPAKLVLETVGGSSPGAGFQLPNYRILIWKPMIFTPTTAPNSPTGTWSDSDSSFYTCSAVVTDSHASDGSDWTDPLFTEIAITAPSGGATSSTFDRGEAMLRVVLPYSTGGADFQIKGIGFSG